MKKQWTLSLPTDEAIRDTKELFSIEQIEPWTFEFEGSRIIRYPKKQKFLRTVHRLIKIFKGKQ
jgi:hypothetical protein